MLPDRILRRLAHPRAPMFAVLLGTSLCAASLTQGLALDDVLQAARVADGSSTPWNLFALFGGDAPLVATQDAPWWTHHEMRLALLRPLTAVTHLLDLRWFTAHPAWMHLHSLLWYALLLAAAGRVYRRFMPGPHAWVLALLLYAVDHSHGMVVGWLAARSAILGALGGLLCLAAHDRWRRGGRRLDGVLAALALVGALLANEGAVGICGYLAAYALCLDRGPGWSRVGSLVPAATLVLVWRACYVAAGFGAAHTGFYFDPAAGTLVFLGRALVHGVLLVGSQVFVPLGEVCGAFPGWYVPAALVVVGMFAAVWALVREDLRGSPLLRFWALGALLSALPLGTTLPTDRQLLLVGVGVFGFAGAWFAGPGRARGRGVRGLAWAWFGLHAVVSPLLLPLRATSPGQLHALAEAATAAVVPAQPPRSVILVRVPSDVLMLYGRASWRLRSRPFPAELQYLYAGLAALTITRVDARTLELRPDGGWLVAPLDRLYREASDEFAAGQRITRGTMTAEILEVTPDGRPRAVRLIFDRPLEDDSFAWYSWEGRIPRPYALPAVGATHTLRAQDNPMLAP